MDESETDSANETAASGPPFRIFRLVVTREPGLAAGRMNRPASWIGIASDASAGRITLKGNSEIDGGNAVSPPVATHEPGVDAGRVNRSASSAIPGDRPDAAARESIAGIWS